MAYDHLIFGRVELLKTAFKLGHVTRETLRSSPLKGFLRRYNRRKIYTSQSDPV